MSKKPLTIFSGTQRVSNHTPTISTCT